MCTYNDCIRKLMSKYNIKWRPENDNDDESKSKTENDDDSSHSDFFDSDSESGEDDQHQFAPYKNPHNYSCTLYQDEDWNGYNLASDGFTFKDIHRETAYIRFYNNMDGIKSLFDLNVLGRNAVFVEMLKHRKSKLSKEREKIMNEKGRSYKIEKASNTLYTALANLDKLFESVFPQDSQGGLGGGLMSLMSLGAADIYLTRGATTSYWNSRGIMQPPAPPDPEEEKRKRERELCKDCEGFISWNDVDLIEFLEQVLQDCKIVDKSKLMLGIKEISTSQQRRTKIRKLNNRIVTDISFCPNELVIDALGDKVLFEKWVELKPYEKKIKLQN